MIGVSMTAVALLIGVDNNPTTTVDGHTLQITRVDSKMGARGRKRRQVTNLTITFTVETKDPSKSFAFEIGRRFVARSADGKSISLGALPASVYHEPAYSIAEFPAEKSDAKTDGRNPRFRAPMTTTLTVLDTDVTNIATLDGDLLVSEAELLEFAFTRDELNPNTVKKSGNAEAKLFLFDVGEHGADIGFKLKLPVPSRSTKPVGVAAFGSERILLGTTDAGRKKRLSAMLGLVLPLGRIAGDSRERIQFETQISDFPRKPDVLHLFIPQPSSARRHVFRLKDVPIPHG